ncbi:MAG: hypothetical protein KDC80_08525, partial [Saprospiraceae bacterium]|nr:hypothetical protein [Saprospiraceae bacterium]
IVGSENQIELQAQIQEIIGEFTSEFDDLIDSGASLIELTQFLNSARLKDFSNRFHCRIPLLIGGEDNFIGPFLTAEWYKRNLYMWSIMQKKIEANDSRILILLGASHIAMIEKLIEQSHDWDPLGFNEFLELTHEGTYSK